MNFHRSCLFSANEKTTQDKTKVNVKFSILYFLTNYCLTTTAYCTIVLFYLLIDDVVFVTYRSRESRLKLLLDLALIISLLRGLSIYSQLVCYTKGNKAIKKNPLLNIIKPI